MADYRVAIHGGAFVFLIGEERFSLFEQSLTKKLQNIHAFINDPNNTALTAIDIVEFAIKLLENDPLYNAGHGSVFTSDRTHELEASIMDGQIGQQMGAASLLKTCKNPISVARKVMEYSDHNYLAGESAEMLAETHGLELVDNSHFSTERRLEQYNAKLQQPEIKHEEEKKGTVGCVCMYNGHVASGTSTGGMTGKTPGRIGDSPIIGSGTYADDRTCAVSLTGTGEEIMRYNAAYDVAARMQYLEVGLHDAVAGTLFQRMPTDTAGIIAVDAQGNVTMQYNTKGMLRGMIGSDGSAVVGIYAEETKIEL